MGTGYISVGLWGQCISAGLWGQNVFCSFVGTVCFSVVLWGLILFICRSVGTECVFLHV